MSDQWLPPFVVTGEDGKPVGTIEVSRGCCASAPVLQNVSHVDHPASEIARASTPWVIRCQILYCSGRAG